jgi:hypothetical protein
MLDHLLDPKEVRLSPTKVHQHVTSLQRTPASKDKEVMLRARGAVENNTLSIMKNILPYSLTNHPAIVSYVSTLIL